MTERRRAPARKAAPARHDVEDLTVALRDAMAAAMAEGLRHPPQGVRVTGEMVLKWAAAGIGLLISGGVAFLVNGVWDLQTRMISLEVRNQAQAETLQDLGDRLDAALSAPRFTVEDFRQRIRPIEERLALLEAARRAPAE